MRNRVFTPQSCPTPEDWKTLLSGDLPTSRIEEMEAHLDNCPVCVAQLEAATPSLSDDVWEAARVAVAVTPAWAEYCSGWAGGTEPPALPGRGLLPFERKGRYKSHGPIEFGGMGEVYLTWEDGLDRWVAIKIPSRDRLSPGLIARFLREAPRQAQLEHPNIVRVYAREEQDGIPYFSMELVKGETLARAGRRNPFAPRRAAELLRQIASAVEYAHQMGVFHHDLKPNNILLTGEGVPKIVDFGLARTLDEPSGQAFGAGAGTPEYMAPEQWEDEPEGVGARTELYRRTDVYGLGTILYELLTGRSPFPPGVNRNETRRRVRFDNPPRPRTLRSGLPRDLEAICVRCLSKRPEERYATAHELADALGRFLGGYPIDDCSWATRVRYFVGRHRRPTAATTAGLLIIAVSLGLFAASRWKHQRAEALIAFDQGQKRLREGGITEGWGQMRGAIDLLPFGETVLRRYFSRNLKSLESSLCREVDSRLFPDEIRAAAVSSDPDERYVLVGDAAGRTILWDRAANQTATLPTRAGRPQITAVAINRSGELYASGDYDGTVTVWDAQSTIRCICTLGHFVKSLAFLGDDELLLTGTIGPDGPALRMWEIFRDGGREIPLETGADLPKTGGEFVVSPTGDRFVSIPSSSRNPCLLWDSKTGRIVARLSREAEGLPASNLSLQRRAAFSGDGRRLAVAGSSLTIYDGKSGALQRRVDAGLWERIQSLELRDDGGATLVVGTREATVTRRMTTDLGIWEDVPIDHSARVPAFAAFTAAGRILTDNSTRGLRLLEPPRQVLPHSDLGLSIGQVNLVASGDGSRIATLTRPGATVSTQTREETGKAESILQVWEGGTLRPISRVDQFAEGCVATSVAYGPTPDSLALGCFTLDGSPAPVLLAAPTPGGELAFQRLGTHLNNVNALAFSTDGSRLITGSTSREERPAELKFWDVKGRSGPTWGADFPATITAIAVSAYDRQIAVGGADGRLRLISIKDQKVLDETSAGSYIAALAFAHAKPLLAVALGTGRFVLFEVPDGSFVPRDQHDEPGAASSAIAFSQNDEILYVNGAGGVQRWDVQTMKSLDPTIRFAHPLWRFTLNSRPEAVVAVTKSGTLIWRTVPNSSTHH